MRRSASAGRATRARSSSTRAAYRVAGTCRHEKKTAKVFLRRFCLYIRAPPERARRAIGLRQLFSATRANRRVRSRFRAPPPTRAAAGRTGPVVVADAVADVVARRRTLVEAARRLIEPRRQAIRRRRPAILSGTGTGRPRATRAVVVGDRVAEAVARSAAGAARAIAGIRAAVAGIRGAISARRWLAAGTRRTLAATWRARIAERRFVGETGTRRLVDADLLRRSVALRSAPRTAGSATT